MNGGVEEYYIVSNFYRLIGEIGYSRRMECFWSFNMLISKIMEGKFEPTLTLKVLRKIIAGNMLKPIFWEK